MNENQKEIVGRFNGVTDEAVFDAAYTARQARGTPIPKSSAAVVIAALTSADCEFSDGVGASDSLFPSQLAAAQVAATDALAGLTGNAPNVYIVLGGKSGHEVAAPVPNAASGQITVTLTEIW